LGEEARILEASSDSLQAPAKQQASFDIVFQLRKLHVVLTVPFSSSISVTQTDSSGTLTFASLDLPAISRFARQLVHLFPRNLVLGLVGTLGAGKTTLVQAIADAAGMDVAEVTSPTFTLLQTHSGTITLHHLDAYRVADEDEFLQLGIDELFDQENAWTLVEWADRMETVMPRETLWLNLELTDDDQRRDIHLRCSDPSVMSSLGIMASQWGEDNAERTADPS
jgi:tRNA threonylcarbamoyladenosine biosynthesis protein TsaE